jgi:hypothetical protein
MPRAPLSDEQLRALEIEEASRALRASLPKRKGNARRSITLAGVQAARAQCTLMVAARDFARATAVHMVALWAYCHEQVYGVAPATTLREWSLASLAAGTIARNDFDGKAERMVPFVRWTWAEERRSAAWRRENGKPINPIGWRLQFSRRHVVKWRANGGG